MMLRFVAVSVAISEALVAVDLPPASGTCSLTEGRIIGTDSFHSEDVVDVGSCCQLCQADVRCAAFTYLIGQDGNATQCVLMDNDYDDGADANRISGVPSKGPPPPTPTPAPPSPPAPPAKVSLEVRGATALATTSPLLTSFTIDACALKQGLDFSDPLLVVLSKHLSPAVLRIGGSDQNNYGYDMEDQSMGSTCSCGHHDSCTMTAGYWKTVHDFAKASNLDLVFGLLMDDADNAASLVYHTAHQNYSNILGYSYGNERTGDRSYALDYLKQMTVVREAIDKAYPTETSIEKKPLLIGADTGIGPRKLGYTPEELFDDEYVASHLAWIKTFVETCSEVLDVVSWHTYDYRSQEVGTTDHHALPWPASSVADAGKLFDPTYHDTVALLIKNISGTVRQIAPGKDLPVWLTETNSICHQGTWNVTNSFINSLWLADRLGIAAGQGVQMMGRQSLIGFNYSLLGNFPADPIFAAPDYFLTVLFKRLMGDVVLQVSKGEEDMARFRPYAFCSREHPGGVALMVVNLNEDRELVVSTGLVGAREDYALTPHWLGDDAPARDRATSHVMALNGQPLATGISGDLPSLHPAIVPESDKQATLTVPALSILVSVFPDAAAAVCQESAAVLV